jgi:hypothetical protein
MPNGVFGIKYGDRVFVWCEEWERFEQRSSYGLMPTGATELRIKPVERYEEAKSP